MIKKIIIFSQWKKMIDIINRELSNTFPNTEIFQVDGSVVDKFSIVEKFRNIDKNAILCTTDCLNYGISIPEADTLIHFDVPWTPAMIEQREGRIDRLTQKSKMLIIKIITENTIEESVLEILKHKQSLINLAIDNKQVEESQSMIATIFKNIVVKK